MTHFSFNSCDSNERALALQKANAVFHNSNFDDDELQVENLLDDFSMFGLSMSGQCNSSSSSSRVFEKKEMKKWYELKFLSSAEAEKESFMSGISQFANSTKDTLEHGLSKTTLSSDETRSILDGMYLERFEETNGGVISEFCFFCIHKLKPILVKLQQRRAINNLINSMTNDRTFVEVAARICEYDMSSDSFQSKQEIPIFSNNDGATGEAVFCNQSSVLRQICLVIFSDRVVNEFVSDENVLELLLVASGIDRRFLYGTDETPVINDLSSCSPAKNSYYSDSSTAAMDSDYEHRSDFFE